MLTAADEGGWAWREMDQTIGSGRASRSRYCGRACRTRTPTYHNCGVNEQGVSVEGEAGRKSFYPWNAVRQVSLMENAEEQEVGETGARILRGPVPRV